jgi:ribosomal-protein-alanine N-acetyltransferase
MAGWRGSDPMKLLERLFGRARLNIEALGPAHAPGMARLHGESFAHGWDMPELSRMLTDPATLGDGLFSGDARQPSAFVLSRLAADEAEVLTICVDASERGRGLGRMLLDRHLHNLERRGIARLFLEVESGNKPALALYRRFGFVQVGERPGYYARPDGSRALALIMRRDLG